MYLRVDQYVGLAKFVDPRPQIPHARRGRLTLPRVTQHHPQRPECARLAAIPRKHLSRGALNQPKCLKGQRMCVVGVESVASKAIGVASKAIGEVGVVGIWLLVSTGDYSQLHASTSLEDGSPCLAHPQPHSPLRSTTC